MDGAWDWRFLGLIPVYDPPRADAAGTIEKARRMGLSIKMITGDHEAIARQIAALLGLGRDIRPASDIFDRAGTSDVASAIEKADGVARVLPKLGELERRQNDLGKRGGQNIARRFDVDAASSKVEEVLIAELTDRRAVTADDLVGINLELGLRVDLGGRR